MGNKLLIKAGILIFTATAILATDITINDIDKLVNDIKQERVGLKEKDILSAKDPFIYPGGKTRHIFYSAKSRKKRYRFVLSAIVNDHVKINRRWYSLNSKINGFRVSEVGRDYVLLSRNNERIRIYLKRPKSKKIKLLVK